MHRRRVEYSYTSLYPTVKRKRNLVESNYEKRNQDLANLKAPKAASPESKKVPGKLNRMISVQSNWKPQQVSGGNVLTVLSKYLSCSFFGSDIELYILYMRNQFCDLSSQPPLQKCVDFIDFIDPKPHFHCLFWNN